MQTGERLKRFEGLSAAAAGYLGMAYHLVGNEAAAVESLEGVAEQSKGEEGGWIVLTLADALVRLGRVEHAREVLIRAQDNAAIADAARRMLAELPAR